MTGRLWIAGAVLVLAGIAAYQTLIPPYVRQAEAIAAAEAARQAAARAQDAADIARQSLGDPQINP